MVLRPLDGYFVADLLQYLVNVTALRSYVYVCIMVCELAKQDSLQCQVSYSEDSHWSRIRAKIRLTEFTKVPTGIQACKRLPTNNIGTRI